MLELSLIKDSIVFLKHQVKLASCIKYFLKYVNVNIYIYVYLHNIIHSHRDSFHLKHWVEMGMPGEGRKGGSHVRT